MKWIDLPPIWTVAALAVTKYLPVGGAWSGIPMLGTIFLVIAAALIGASLVEFARMRTTVIPHKTATALITSGIFALSRNPIYLADLLILAGLSLIWGKALGLILMPVLAWILTTRFIVGEEQRLHDSFGEAFQDYTARTRRWI